MRNHVVGIVLLTATAAAPAAAQDRAASFTGVRVEGLAGYENTHFSSVDEADGAVYGLGLGFDFGAGAVRFGLEGEASDSSSNLCRQSVVGRFCERAERDLYAGARAGAVVGSRVLLYAKAGYSNFRGRVHFTPAAGGSAIVTNPEWDGVRAGAGAEFALGGRSYFKAEYRFSNYENSKSFDRHQGVVGVGIRF